MTYIFKYLLARHVLFRESINDAPTMFFLPKHISIVTKMIFFFNSSTHRDPHSLYTYNLYSRGYCSHEQRVIIILNDSLSSGNAICLSYCAILSYHIGVIKSHWAAFSLDLIKCSRGKKFVFPAGSATVVRITNCH